MLSKQLPKLISYRYRNKNSYQENYQLAEMDGMSMTTAERQNIFKALHIHVRIILKNLKYIANCF
jgi:hypothetical protein